MKRLIIVLMFVFLFLDGDVFTGNNLPLWGKVCTKTGVYGDPYGLHAPLYFLPIGEKVRLHELSQSGEPWVMIKPALWIPMQALCNWN